MIGLNSNTSHDSRAVVTGAGSGIGRAFAIELAERGGRVVGSDRDLVAAQRTADQSPTTVAKRRRGLRRDPADDVRPSPGALASGSRGRPLW